MLSHYTGRAGLEGIARTKTLWATNFLQLNDKTEIEYGLVELTKLSLRMAWAEIEGHLRADDYRGDIDYDQAGNLVAQQFRKSISETPGESLYVFSRSGVACLRYGIDIQGWRDIVFSSIARRC